MVRTCTGEVWVRSTSPVSLADLSVGAGDVERVLHGPGRVVLGEVQRVEVEPLRLELGTLRHLPAHRHEDVLDLRHHRGDRMSGTGRAPVVGQGDVDGLLGQHPGIPLGDQFGLAGRDGIVDPSAGLADGLTGGGLVGLGQVGDGPIGQGQRALVAGVREPGRLECVEVCRGGDCDQVLGPSRLRWQYRRSGRDGQAGSVGGGHGDLPGRGDAGQRAQSGFDDRGGQQGV